MKPNPSQFERVLVTLPKNLVGELRKFSGLVRAGNKSGFVADAVRMYIKHLRKERRTAKLREAYAASARDSLRIATEWETLDDESWDMLESRKAKAPKV